MELSGASDDLAREFYEKQFTAKDKIDQLWDKFWSGGIFNPLTAIEQITYLLFMKRLNDLDLKNKADAEFTGDFYISFLGVTLGVTFFQNLLKSAKI